MMIYNNNFIATAARKVTCSKLLTTVTDLLKHKVVIRNIAFSTSVHRLVCWSSLVSKHNNNFIITAARNVTCSTLLNAVTDLLKHKVVIRNIAFSTSVHCLITLVLKSIKYKNTIVSTFFSFSFTSQKSYVAV